MKPVISPKELASAIGVSESSLKRWVDHGQIRVFRTVGGHRRIPIGEAIRFIRASKATLIHPEILGLKDLVSARNDISSPDTPAANLFAHLAEGRASEARGLILSLYLSGYSVAQIADGPIRDAMTQLGELWRHDVAGIFVEHRATDIAAQAVQQLRVLVEPDTPRFIAVGAGAPCDPYLLPSLLCATALAAENVHAINLGPDTPLETLMTAVERSRPRLVWLSFSSVRSAPEMEMGIQQLANRLAPSGVPLVLGGQALANLQVPAEPNVHVTSTLVELVQFVRDLPHDEVRPAPAGA